MDGRRYPTLTYLQLLERLDHWFAEGIAAAGPGVVPCRAGCSACCHGPFDISPADAREVARAVAHLPAGTRDAVHRRATAARDRQGREAPGWGAPWDVAAIGEAGLDALSDALAGDPCPALDPPTGNCLIHAARPATCRITGLAMRLTDGQLLENVCPIQGEHPEYAVLAATPFDLLRWEREAEGWDADAGVEGWVATTVAGAITASS